MIASYERIESILRLELEAARADFSATQDAAPDVIERYQRALTRFNAFVIRREVPPDLRSFDLRSLDAPDSYSIRYSTKTERP
jgi:hypothetical protein